MKKFEIGKIYFAKSLMDPEHPVYKYRVVSRTKRTVTVEGWLGPIWRQEKRQIIKSLSNEAEVILGLFTDSDNVCASSVL